MWLSKIRNRAIALGLVPLAFLLLVLAIAAVQQSRTAGTEALIRHSDDALAKNQQLSLTLAAMDRDLRDYLLKHKPQLLDAYRREKATVPAEIAALKRVVADDPPQETRANAIGTLATQITELIDQYNALYSSGHRRQAEASVNNARVRSIGDAWQAQTTAFTQAEAQEKLAQWDRSRAQSAQLDWALGLAAGIGFLLTIFATWRFGLNISKRLDRLSLTARRVEAGNDLETPIEGNDEIADLDQAYHRMALEMQKREATLEKYRLLAQRARDVFLFIRRSDGRILEANAAAQAMYGYSKEELHELRGRDLRAPEALETVDAELENSDRYGTSFETLHRRKDGSTFPVEVTAQSTVIDGERVVLSIIRDITDRREAHSQIQAALSSAVEASLIKSQFVATMSHEIRTPMNAVIGMIELLLESPLSQEQRRCATVVRDSGELLLSVINDILDFSKIEANRVDLEVVEFSLPQLIEGIAGLFIAQAAAKQLALMTYIDPAIPQTLVGDPNRLRQVIVNIVANALKFTQKGAVVVSADLVHASEQSAAVSFTIKDTGIGIAPDAIETLFEPFRQADGSTTRKYGGTGLGLSISKGLVERMGGAITVASSEGTGSTFAFTLDFNYSSEPVSAPASVAGLRALILDDDPIARQIFTRYLSSWHMRPTAVADAMTAHALLRKGAEDGDPYDVAIVDLAMPEMNGFAFGSRVRADSRLGKTRLIMVTAYDAPEQGRRAIADGFSAYLPKPVRQSQLFDCIANTYRLTIPAENVAEQRESGDAAEHILVAEDNAVNRDLALLQLKRLSYSAEAVGDGVEAVKAAATGRFTTVLMDCQMPNMDGFEATRRIRKAENRTGTRLRIIAMTANALAEDRDACLAAGMDDYLTKPVTLDELRRVLGQQSIDLERLKELIGGGDREIFAFLQNTLPALQEVVQRLNDASNAATQRSVAHELKGAAANLGAVELAHLASLFESALREGRAEVADYPARILKAYDKLVTETQRLNGVLEGRA